MTFGGLEARSFWILRICLLSAAERFRTLRDWSPDLGDARHFELRPAWKALQPRICLSGMVERSSRHSEAQDPGPRAWCVCGQKVTVADAREVTLPNGRPGWEGYCPECGGPLFTIRRKPADG